MTEVRVLDTVINYKCPNCAAPLEFGIATQQWDCHFCNSSFTQQQIEQLAKTENGADKQPEEASWKPNAFSGEDMVSYSCPSCGGRVMADKHTAATFCTFCHNPTLITEQLTGQYQPAYIIPFQKQKQDAVASLQSLCKGKPLLAKSFRQAAEKGEVTGLYVPYWLFSAGAFAALGGTGTRVSTWSDSNYIYTKTDSYRVERDAEMSFVKVPADASSRMDDKLMEALEPFNYEGLLAFEMPYLSGMQAESWDVDAAQCSQRFRQRAQQAAEMALRQQVSGYSSIMTDRLDCRFHGQETLYVMLPVWVMNVMHGGKRYTYAMNGQTGKTVGKLPISAKRVMAWLGGLAGGLSVLISLIRLFIL